MSGQGMGHPGGPGFGQAGYGVPGYGPSGYGGPPGFSGPGSFDSRSGPTSAQGMAMPAHGAPGYGAVGYGAPPGYGSPAYGAPAYGQQQQQQQPGASLLNPWNMINGISNMGQTIQGGTHYVEAKVNWFTGGFFGTLFHIDPAYVTSKLLLLMLPYLRKYDYMRQTDNIAGNVPVMKPPRGDLFAPDLYIPLMSFATYVVVLGCNKFMNGSFAPDVMYNMFAWASTAWAVNFGALFVLTKMMALHAQPPWLDVVAFSGYSFVHYCLSTLLGWAMGAGLGWHAAWLYTSTCMAIFLIRSYKQVIRIDAAQRGVAAGRNVSYLLLVIGAMQYVLAWVMGATVHGHAIRKGAAAATAAGRSLA